jgi:hypothetical protein
VTLPEVVTGELAGKFGEISLFNQHADFKLESASNSNSTSPWAIVCEPATQPSHVVSPPCERFARGPRNLSRARTEAPPSRQAGKEAVPEYNSDSDTAPGHASDSNPLSGFYSDSAYEFDFGSDPEDPESEDNTTGQPLSGPASGLVITSTPAGRFVYWPDRKPTDLISGDSRYVAYLDSLPFQEGTPLARAEEYTPTEVASSDSSLGNPDRQVFMATGDTPGLSGMVEDRYLEDISATSCLLKHPRTRPTPTGMLDVSVTESGTNGAGVSETTSPSATSQKPSSKSRVGYTPPRSNASCRSQRSHAKLRGYVLEKSSPSSQKTLTSCEGSPSRPPLGTAKMKLQVAVRTSAVTVLEPSCRLIPTVLVQTPVDPHKSATAPQLLPAIVRSSPTATLAPEAAMAEAPTTAPTRGPVAEAIAVAEATRTATPPEPHRAATMPTED